MVEHGVLAQAESCDQFALEECALKHAALGLDDGLDARTTAARIGARGEADGRYVSDHRARGRSPDVGNAHPFREKARGVFNATADGVADVVLLVHPGVVAGRDPIPGIGDGLLDAVAQGRVEGGVFLLPSLIEAQRRMPVGVLAILLILVFVIAENLLRAQPPAQAPVLGEIETIDALGAGGLPQPRPVAEEGFVAPEIGPAEIGIGGAVQVDLVHVDLELAHVAVNARGTHRLVLQPLGILPQEGDLCRQGMLGRVEDELVELGEIGINVVPSLAVARKIDAAPIVDGAVADRPGHGIIKGLLRGGVGFGGTRGQKTDPGLGGRKRIGRRKYGRAVGRGRVGVSRHRPIRRLARGADLEDRAIFRTTGDEVGRRDRIRRGGAEDVAVAVNLAVAEGDQTRDRIPTRPAGLTPICKMVAGSREIWPHRRVFITIPRGRQRGVFEGLELDLKAEPTGVLLGGLADETGVLVGVARPHRQLVLKDPAVHIERGAPAVVAVSAKLHPGEVARQIGGRRHLVDGAGSVAQAEDVGVGPTAQFEGVHPERINRHATGCSDIVERNVGVADAAHAIGVVRIQTHLIDDRARAVGIKLGVGTRALGARHVIEHVVDIEHREVDHLLLGHHGDRLAEVLDFRVHARARHRVGGEIALVLGNNFERRQDERFPPSRPRGQLDVDGSGRRLRGISGGRLFGVESAVAVGVVSGESPGIGGRHRRNLGASTRGEEGDQTDGHSNQTEQPEFCFLRQVHDGLGGWQDHRSGGIRPNSGNDEGQLSFQ